MDIANFILIALASGLAGFVDAVVGGGGLILVPSFFAIFPGAPPASLLGNNKATSVWGTAFASWAYSKRIVLPIKSLIVGGTFALVGSFAGAWCVTKIPATIFKAALPIVLVALLIYTLLKKDFGQVHAPKFDARGELFRLAFIGGFLGFYDGFFGPGTGSLFVFILVRWLGFDFLHASAGAKILNTASNSAALLLFSINGYIWWHIAIPLAVANVGGSLLGTRLSLQKGAGFIRYFFIVVVFVLIIKTSFDFIWSPALASAG